MSREWGALTRYLKISGEKPTHAIKYICDLLDQLSNHFDMYYTDAKATTAALKIRITELENRNISMAQQMEAMQYQIERLSNKTHALSTRDEIA